MHPGLSFSVLPPSASSGLRQVRVRAWILPITSPRLEYTSRCFSSRLRLRNRSDTITILKWVSVPRLWYLLSSSMSRLTGLNACDTLSLSNSLMAPNLKRKVFEIMGKLYAGLQNENDVKYQQQLIQTKLTERVIKIIHFMLQQQLRNDHPAHQSLDCSLKPELLETHTTVAGQEQCPGCSKPVSHIIYYSCCLGPSCSNCFSGFHYLECGYAKRNRDSMAGGAERTKQEAETRELCQRCEGKIVEFGYSCRECHICALCANCFSTMHNGSKFQTHSSKKYHLPSQPGQQLTLTCSSHNKIRNLLTETGQLICPECLSRTATRRPKALTYSQTAVEQKKADLCGRTKSIIAQSISQRAKWNQIREQLKDEYHRIMRMVSDRYEQNMAALSQMEQFDLRAVDRAVNHSRKVVKESQLDIGNLGINRDVFVARLAILEQTLIKFQTQMQHNEQFAHKIGSIDIDKLEALLKQFTICKQRQSSTDDKENLSIRKPIPSLAKQDQNLSVSRRSLSKSISKMDSHTNGKNNRTSGLKDNTGSINVSIEYSYLGAKKNVNQSVNLSQVKTQPIRNSTPMMGKPVNSSEKKEVLLRQSSILSAKLEDITPVLLNFDSKETNRSRINFLSSKTEDEGQQVSLTENDQQASQSRMSKRKSDYFELRDRMRKPNIVNNRFSRR